MAAQTPAKQLYDLLVSKNYDPELLDSAGKTAEDPAETEIFSFDYTSESGNDYGTVVIMLNSDNELEVYFGDNIGRGMESDDKKQWFDFLYQLRMFAKRNLMSFGLKNLNRLRYSMQGQAAVKEGLFESWTGTRTQSWNGRPTEARLMIKHKRPLGETDARFRYIESLFIETAEGERYKLPFTKLSGGRAMVEHVRQGGRPYDVRGQHIAEMVAELNVLSRFRRANHGKVFEGDTAALVEQTNAYYETAQRTLKSLSTNSGYARYFESWNPKEVSEQSVVIEGIKHLFVTQSIDQRIEEALPILARIQQQGTEMKEANIFETWANTLVEGTWALPDTPEKQAQLVELLSKDFPVGADATTATEQLYDLIGDDELFDQLEELASRDANADARQIILNRMQELANDPDVAEVIAKLNVDMDTPAEPAEVEVDADVEVDSEVKESEYPEYQDNLSTILKHAGVEPQDNPAPDYEAEVAEDARPGVTADFSLEEGRVKQLVMDIKELSDSEFWDKYGKTKQVMQKMLGEEQLDEFAPLAAALGGALARGVVGAGASALEKGLATAAGRMAGSAVGDALDSDEMDETVDPTNPRDYEIPAYLRKKQGQAPLTPADVKAKDEKAQRDFEKRLGHQEVNENGLSRIKTLAGILAK